MGGSGASDLTPWGGRLSRVTDADAWTARSSVRVRESFSNTVVDEWLSGEPGAFDTRHAETARLLVTNRGVSPSIIGAFSFDDLVRSVPMGYTDLGVVEKRAVIVGGRIARLWAQAHEPAPSQGAWTLLVPDDEPPRGDVGPLAMSAGGVVWHGLQFGCRVSRLMGGRAALLVRQLESHAWH